MGLPLDQNKMGMVILVYMMFLVAWLRTVSSIENQTGLSAWVVTTLLVGVLESMVVVAAGLLVIYMFNKLVFSLVLKNDQELIKLADVDSALYSFFDVLQNGGYRIVFSLFVCLFIAQIVFFIILSKTKNRIGT